MYLFHLNPRDLNVGDHNETSVLSHRVTILLVFKVRWNFLAAHSIQTFLNTDPLLSFK